PTTVRGADGDTTGRHRCAQGATDVDGPASVAPLPGGELGRQLARERTDRGLKLRCFRGAGEQEVLALQRVPDPVARDAIATADLGVAPRGLGLDAATEVADAGADLVPVEPVAEAGGAPFAGAAPTRR